MTPSGKISGSHFFAGEIVGHCVLRKLLAVREHREVWLVFDRARQDSAVLKFVHKNHRRAEIFPALADFLLHSKCPELVRAFDCFSLGDYYAAELEYVSGGSLAQRLRKDGRFTLGQTVYLLRGMLGALTELHSHGIVHRDIKPGNILLTSDSAVKLGDLGTARMKSHPEKGPQIFGTAPAMSPEQAVDTTKADERSDFFSLSSVIYELLTGQPRFPRGPFVDTLKLIQVSRPDDFQKELAPFAPGDLISLLERMAANQPEDRPASAEVIAAELERMHLPCEKSPQGEPAEKQPEAQ